MSKSLGNFVTINELLRTRIFGGRQWPGPVLRLAMLATHYRQPIDWTVAGLNEAERVLQDWSAFVDGAPEGDVPQAVIEALADDLNTPKLLAALHTLRKAGRVSELRGSLSFLGIDLLAKEAVELSEKEIGDIEARIAERNAARARKDWKGADRIRDELLASGIQLKDNKDGTTSWAVKSVATGALAAPPKARARPPCRSTPPPPRRGRWRSRHAPLPAVEWSDFRESPQAQA